MISEKRREFPEIKNLGKKYLKSKTWGKIPEKVFCNEVAPVRFSIAAKDDLHPDDDQQHSLVILFCHSVFGHSFPPKSSKIRFLPSDSSRRDQTVQSMSGVVYDTTPVSTRSKSMGKYHDDSKSIETNGHSESPLKLFVIAKKSINESFGHISSYVNESINFLKNGQSVIPAEVIAEKSELVDKVNGIREVLARDHMKVAFFGRTSNGKSTVINAVLGTKILPSGMGHTTNCFLQVEGSDLEEAFLCVEDSEEGHQEGKRKPVESVSSLANALSSEKLDDASLVRIFWPKTKCKILHDDVVLVDSPGIDVSPNLDEWIDRHCLSADVFVLVSNAESTLMRTEKAFFHKVSQRLSNPNIFILNNRWDAVAAEPEDEDAVRKQHLEREVAFLTEELAVIDKREAVNRVFFVSAKEVLQHRLNLASDPASRLNLASDPASVMSPPPPSCFVAGHENRLREFEEFERRFEECLSKSAIRTKFDQHTKRGQKIVLILKDILEDTHVMSEDVRNRKLSDRSDLHHKLKSTSLGLDTIRTQITNQIRNLVESVESKVSSALNEEIRRLSLLVNDYEKPFNPEPIFLTGYKKDLHLHVEKGLGSNLKARLSTALTTTVDAASDEMINQVFSILPPDSEILKDPSRSGLLIHFGSKRTFSGHSGSGGLGSGGLGSGGLGSGSSAGVSSNSPFEVFYRLNCDSLCSDFQEDLEFRFSLGLISMIKKFMNRNPFKRDAKIPASFPGGASGPGGTPPSLTDQQVANLANESMLLMLLERATTAAPQSQTTIGALALGGFMVRTIGWRIIGLVCGIYAALYAYERLTWTNKAKEKAFKRQYVAHATRKLKLIVDLTSANCSHQVQQ